MKRIFHWGEILARLPFFATLGFVILLWGGTYAYTQSSETGSSKTHIKSESIEFTPTVSSNYKRYTGPQNAQELMKALDGDYNKGLSKKLPETIPETKVIISNGSLVIRNGEILERPKTTTYSSDLTISEIDARYPRAEWLQLLLDKGITIDNSDEYASLLSKRYLLILLEDNPDLYEAGFRGIPPTDDWETYKAAYINKLVSKHTGKQIERSREQIKLALKRSKESIVRAMTQLEHKALKSQQLEHVRKQLEHARKQIARAQEALERSEEPMHPQEPLPPDEPN